MSEDMIYNVKYPCFYNTNRQELSKSDFIHRCEFMMRKDGIQPQSKSACTNSVEEPADISPKSKSDKRGFKGIAGMKELKARMQRDFIDLLNNRELAEAYGILPPPILLYGAHGCGKTFFVRKLAEELSLDFMVVNPDDIASSYIHGTQRKIADIFKKARAKNGTLLFIDEFDSMAGHRSQSEHLRYQSEEVAEFLTQMNNLAEDNVFVIAATNHPEHIDRAILRSGRLDSIVYVPLPDLEARTELFEMELMDRPKNDAIDCVKLAEMTVNYTASDITSIVKAAARETFDYSNRSTSKLPLPIEQTTIENIIKTTPSSVSESDIRFYERLQAEFSPDDTTKKKKTIGFV